MFFGKSYEKIISGWFNEYYQPLCNYAKSITGNDAEAEDIVINIFGNLWDKESRMIDIENIKSYLYASARNACLDYLKQQNRDRYNRQMLGYLSEEDENNEISESTKAWVLQELYTEIESLPKQCKTVWKLILQGWQTDEIAEQLDISVKTVRSQKARGIQLLKIAFLKKGISPLLLIIYINSLMGQDPGC